MIIQKRKNMFVAKERGFKVLAVIGSVRNIVRERADQLASIHRQNEHNYQVCKVISQYEVSKQCK